MKTLHIQALAARFERRLGKKLEAMNEKHGPEEGQRTGDGISPHLARYKAKAKAMLLEHERRGHQVDAADVAELMLEARGEQWLEYEAAIKCGQDEERNAIVADLSEFANENPNAPQNSFKSGIEWATERIKQRSGEARPEAGRDDAADWDPCRWCSAGIETVRHLPGGTCPRTGRTRPGRERATLLCHICRAHEAKIGGDCGLHPVTSAAWKAENEMLRYRGALREIVNGNYDGENARRCAEEALESSGDPKEVK